MSPIGLAQRDGQVYIGAMHELIDRPWTAPALILAASAGALAFAFAAQYGFGLEPCVLCLYQRWPFAIAVLLGGLGLGLAAGGRSPAWALGLAGLVLLANAGIAAYHVGVEQHWWAGTAGCVAETGGAQTLAELKAQVLAAPLVRCDEVAWSFLGLSMAAWNVPLSGGLALFSLLVAARQWRLGAHG